MGVVGIHDMVPRAHLCKAAGDMVTRDAILMGILHALIAMMDTIDLTLYVMLVVVWVMSQQIAMSLLLPFSSRNTNYLYPML